MIKKYWFILLLSIVVIIGTVVLLINIIEVSESLTSLQIVDSDKLMAMIRNKEDMVIVDLREPELYTAGRVPGAINISFNEIQSRYVELPPEKKIIFVCHTGRMGIESGTLLLENGYQHVYNLEGGIAVWTGVLQK